jgi:hypothetical protein
VRLRLTGLLGGLATASALALAACGGDEKTVETVTDEPGSSRLENTLGCLEDEGYDANAGHVNAASRRDGTTGALSVVLDLEGGSAPDSVVDVYFWNSRENATEYVKDVGDGPLDDLHHEQLGTVTITYSHGHSHGAEHAGDTHDSESEQIDHEVDAIAACVA